jgi:hypothetical protein
MVKVAEAAVPIPRQSAARPNPTPMVKVAAAVPIPRQSAARPRVAVAIPIPRL